MESFDPNHQNANIEGKIVASLERISEAFKVLLWQEGKEHSLTPLQLQLLVFIKFHTSDYCKVNYLAQEFNVTKATISESIRLLTKKKYVFKEKDAIDTRSFTIHLTPKGKEIVSQGGSFAEAIEKAVHALEKNQKEHLFQHLITIIEKLQKAEIVTTQRMCFSCRFYEKGEGTAYCRLLNMPLFQKDLRLDCPEHQVQL